MANTRRNAQHTILSVVYVLVIVSTIFQFGLILWEFLMMLPWFDSLFTVNPPLLLRPLPTCLYLFLLAFYVVYKAHLKQKEHAASAKETETDD